MLWPLHNRRSHWLTVIRQIRPLACAKQLAIWVCWRDAVSTRSGITGERQHSDGPALLGSCRRLHQPDCLWLKSIGKQVPRFLDRCVGGFLSAGFLLSHPMQMGTPFSFG